ncbi:MAG: hypothetical protein ABR517_09330 [Thermoanaerobaculia bacterium]
MSRPERKVTVTEKNLQKAADRIDLPTPLVSVEIDYLRRHLGASATPTEIDNQVREVRSTPWSQLL